MALKKRAGAVHKPVPMSSGSVLIALASLRNTEAQLRWQGAQWAITLNTSTLVALMYRILANPKPAELVILAVGCLTVAVLNVIWHTVLRRDGMLFNFWNKLIFEHERKNGIDGGMEVFHSIEYAKLSHSRNRLQRRLERLTITFILFWTIVPVILLVLT